MHKPSSGCWLLNRHLSQSACMTALLVNLVPNCRLALRLHPDKARNSNSGTASAVHASSPAGTPGTANGTAVSASDGHKNAPTSGSSSKAAPAATAATADLFALVSHAYRTLSNTEARAAYDLARLMRRLVRTAQ